MNELSLETIRELRRIIEILGGGEGILNTLDCYGDTLNEAEMLPLLRIWQGEQSPGVLLILAERHRQVLGEGWTASHDDKHKKFQMTKAARSYALAVCSPDQWSLERGRKQNPEHDWPWAKKWWKPSGDPIRNLVKAGALIAAEIDRLKRKERKGL